MQRLKKISIQLIAVILIHLFSSFTVFSQQQINVTKQNVVKASFINTHIQFKSHKLSSIQFMIKKNIAGKETWIQDSLWQQKLDVEQLNDVILISNKANVDLNKSIENGIYTILLPEHNKLSIDIKYGNLTVVNYFNEVSVSILNGNSNIAWVNNLSLESKYGNANIAKVNKADIMWLNGNLYVQQANWLELQSKYAHIDVDATDSMHVKSLNDELSIAEIKSLYLEQQYGKLHIKKLEKILQFKGLNTDIAVRKMSESVKLLDIQDQYASIQIPLSFCKNYSLSYLGTYGQLLLPIQAEITTKQNGEQELKQEVGNEPKNLLVNLQCKHCNIDLN